MLRLLFSWFRKIIIAALWGVATMIAVVIFFLSKLPIIQEPAKTQAQTDVGTPVSIFSNPTFWWVAGFAFLFFVLHTIFRFRQLTYDTTWAEKLQERFDKLESDGVRANAAKILKDYHGHLTDKKNHAKMTEIEPVLDFFEDLGFYVSGDQISPEVAHHYFYHWLRGYWIAAQKYINQYRRSEPKTYKYIEPLFKTLAAKEYFWDKNKRRQEGKMSIKELDEFLDEEMWEDEVQKKLKGKKK
jgi:hypothetical protein